MTTIPPLLARGQYDLRLRILDLCHSLRHYAHEAEIALVQWERMAPFSHCIDIRIGDQGLVVPVVRGWPLATLGPAALSTEIERIATRMVSMGDFLTRNRQEWGGDHAIAALVLHAEAHGIPEGALMDDGTALVDCRLDADGNHVFWLDPFERRLVAPFRLDVTGERIETLMGDLPVICSVDEDQGPGGLPSICMLPAADDKDGILVNAVLPDPVERLRLLARLAATRNGR